MTQPSRIHLFQAYGIELEYMLVDRDTLEVKPISDALLKHQLGNYGSDFENGMITWSNELVLHVIELKSTRPEFNFSTLENEFVTNIVRINNILSGWNAMLMPTAAHPLMNPLEETKLWPHDSNEVYSIYDNMFNCKGHGWSNLQSTHLNLPFYDDEEFARLHAAVRLVLPILPALCASSPLLEGRATGSLDTRLLYYKTNQAKIPSITGKIIPEAVFSKRNYLNTIYEKIKQDIAPFDPGQELNPIWVNSRGAIPRFDRGSIEIRIMDIQECPAADLAIVYLVTELIKALVANKFIELEAQMKWRTDPLALLLDRTTTSGHRAIIDNPEYLGVFGYPEQQATAGELWSYLLEWVCQHGHPALLQWKPQLDIIIQRGPLATRILESVGQDASHERIVSTYKKLASCLSHNKMFLD